METEARALRAAAHAKINVGLDIVGKRPDGYHELNTIFYELQLHDTLELERTKETGIQLTCSDPALPAGEDNLAYRAARLFLEWCGIREGVRIHLAKRIPFGAGLGGGSSDAAAVLVGMNTMFGQQLPAETLCALAAELGADVPFFIRGGCAQAEGIGERLVHYSGVRMPPMLVVKPEAAVPTAWAYRAADECPDAVHPDMEKLLQALLAGSYDEICRFAGNTFEPAVFAGYPEIRQLKERLLRLGAGACVMTGSGAAVYALFREIREAEEAARQLSAQDNSLRIFPEYGQKDNMK